MGRDPAGYLGDPNASLYRYVLNSPVNAMDPDGRDPQYATPNGSWPESAPHTEAGDVARLGQLGDDWASVGALFAVRVLNRFITGGPAAGATFDDSVLSDIVERDSQFQRGFKGKVEEWVSNYTAAADSPEFDDPYFGVPGGRWDIPDMDVATNPYHLQVEHYGNIEAASDEYNDEHKNGTDLGYAFGTGHYGWNNLDLSIVRRGIRGRRYGAIARQSGMTTKHYALVTINGNVTWHDDFDFGNLGPAGVRYLSPAYAAGWRLQFPDEHEIYIPQTLRSAVTSVGSFSINYQYNCEIVHGWALSSKHVECSRR